MKPTIHTHKVTTPHCGACGPIVYERGKAWSVNADRDGVMDWRFELDYAPKGCPECDRHIAAAKEESK